ncbi:MAG: WG repeat-containing protein [Bacteroidetes bacterium]|nr:WG repeat-containing protein [Bacteroidota bacterium]
MAIKNTFHEVRDFHDSVAAVKTKGKWGYFDTNGNIIITPQFENCLNFTLIGK